MYAVHFSVQSVEQFVLKHCHNVRNKPQDVSILFSTRILLYFELLMVMLTCILGTSRLLSVISLIVSDNLDVSSCTE